MKDSKGRSRFKDIGRNINQGRTVEEKAQSLRKQELALSYAELRHVKTHKDKIF